MTPTGWDVTRSAVKRGQCSQHRNHSGVGEWQLTENIEHSVYGFLRELIVGLRHGRVVVEGVSVAFMDYGNDGGDGGGRRGV